MKLTVYKFHLKNVFIAHMKRIDIKVTNRIAFTYSSRIYFKNEKACSLNIFVAKFLVLELETEFPE